LAKCGLGKDINLTPLRIIAQKGGQHCNWVYVSRFFWCVGLMELRGPASAGAGLNRAGCRSKASSKLKANSYKAQGKTSCRNVRGEQVRCRKKKLLGKCDEIPNTEKNLGQG